MEVAQINRPTPVRVDTFLNVGSTWLKWLRGKIYADRYFTKETKDSIWELVYQLVYASTEYEYERVYAELKAIYKNDSPASLSSKQPTTFADYFDKNWHSMEFPPL